MTKATPFRIQSLTLNDGQVLSLSNITVLVGPNNSGKSRALLDAVTLSTTQNTPPPTVIVSDVDLDGPESWDEMKDILQDLPIFRSGGYSLYTIKSDFLGVDTKGVNLGQSTEDSVTKYITRNLSGGSRKRGLREFMQGAIAHLKTDTRLSLLADTSMPGDALKPQNLLQSLYKAGTATEQRISDTVQKYFGKQVRLDFTNPKHLRLRFAENFDDVPTDPRDALPHMAKRELLGEQGDGVRSFTTIIAALEIMQRSIFITDEPEAFLHPPQASHIGRILAAKASDERQIIIATHSADILRGVLSVAEDVTILRIDRTGNTNSFCKVDAATIHQMTSDPLLSSARVLDGLFYSSAVVVEADADAKFFSSAFNRLNKELDAHFVAAENKQTVARILNLYSQMGVKHVGIVDFDMLRVKSELSNAMSELGIPESEQESIQTVRDLIADEANQRPVEVRLQEFKDVLHQINEKVTQIDEEDSTVELDKTLHFLQKRATQAAHITKPWKLLKEKGKFGLSPEIQSQFDTIYDQLLDYGLCIYPLGELESSLVEFGLDYTTDKRKWLVAALRMIYSLEVDQTRPFWHKLFEILDRRLMVSTIDSQEKEN